MSITSMKVKKRDIYTYGPMVILLLYSFFYQAFFTSSILKYGLFGIALLLILSRGIKKRVFTGNFYIWMLFVMYMLVTCVSPISLPTTLSITITMTLLMAGTDYWTDRFVKVVMSFTMVHAVITIVCWIVPALRTSFIVPVFFRNYSTRGEIMWYQCGFTNHYSSNGMYLGFGVIAAGILFINTPKKHRMKSLIALAIMMLALLLTTKRTHLVAALLSVITVYLLISKITGRILSNGFKIFIIISVVLLAFVALAPSIPFLGAVMDRFAEIAGDNTYHGRSFFYEVALQQWQTNTLFGSGWGGFTEAFSKTSLGISYINNGYGNIQPHNVYLQLLSDLGLVGLGLFLFAVANLFITANKQLRLLNKGNDYGTNWIMLQFSVAIMTYYLICGFTGNPLNDVQLYIPFFIANAAVFGFASMHKN